MGYIVLILSRFLCLHICALINFMKQQYRHQNVKTKLVCMMDGEAPAGWLSTSTRLLFDAELSRKYIKRRYINLSHSDPGALTTGLFPQRSHTGDPPPRHIYPHREAEETRKRKRFLWLKAWCPRSLHSAFFRDGGDVVGHNRNPVRWSVSTNLRPLWSGWRLVVSHSTLWRGDHIRLGCVHDTSGNGKISSPSGTYWCALMDVCSQAHFLLDITCLLSAKLPDLQFASAMIDEPARPLQLYLHENDWLLICLIIWVSMLLQWSCEHTQFGNCP